MLRAPRTEFDNAFASGDGEGESSEALGMDEAIPR